MARMLLFVNWSFARWNEGGFKNSPLFKHSLNEAITNMENQGKQARDEGESMATTKPNCNVPDAPLTSLGQPTCYETCVPTQCWGECYTQAYTCSPTVCGGTCSGGYTCTGTCQGQSTCYNTCSGNTCTNTCVGGVCQNYQFCGIDYWVWPPYYGSNWYVLEEYFYVTPEYDNITNRVKWTDSGWYGLGVIDDYSTGEYSGSKIRTTTSCYYAIDGGGWMWDILVEAYYSVYGRTDVYEAAEPYPAWNEVDVYINVVSPY